jgi:hypothetical protein
MAHVPEQGHNHNLDSVALNYPYLISRPRIVTHNRTKRRENGIHERSYFLSIILVQVYNTPFKSRMQTGPSTGALGPAVDVFCVDGGHFRTSGITSQGATVDVFCVDGGLSWISGTASQGDPHQYFLALMVGATESSAPLPSPPSTFLALMVGAPRSLTSPLRGSPSTFFCVDGGCSRIYGIASQGAHHRCFLC